MKLKSTLALLFLVQFAFGQNRIQKIDSLLSSKYNNGKLNGNVLIAEKGKVIYNRSFGLANEITKEKLNENSIFELESVSKQFTAMAIVILKEQGKLNYDDKITKYLPELSNYSNVSIRNLLNHTSGIPDYLEMLNSPSAKEYASTNLVGKIATNKDIIAFFSKYKPQLKFEPNTVFEYSNTGYVFLASIIERLSGMTYADYLDKVIFKPLEMSNTLVYTRRLFPKNLNNYAYGHVYSDSLKKYCLIDSLTKAVTLLDGIVGDARVNSTVSDLLKWDRALYTDKLVSHASMKVIFQGAKLRDNTIVPYGFGWFLEDNSGYGKISKHGGSGEGYSTYIERDIDNAKTIIILQNHSSALFPLGEVHHIIYNRPYPKVIELTNEQLQKLVGTYVFQEGFKMNISISEGHLDVQAPGQDVTPFFPENELLFFSKVLEAKIQFEKNETGEVTHLFILNNGNKTKAEKKK
jgi:CubicO group peptidase (beta-lactamase class C family)